jgi:hypothetical protein
MYLEQLISRNKSEPQVPALQQVVKEDKGVLINRIHLVKGLIIASVLSLPIWTVIVLVVF